MFVLLLKLNPLDHIQVFFDLMQHPFALVLTLDNKLYYSNENSGETIDSENMLHFKMITGPDGITGLSPIEQCKNAIGWGMDVQEYSSTFFKNGKYFCDCL